MFRTPTSKVASTLQMDLPLFERWLHFLTFTASSPKNVELCRDYFFEQFAFEPEKFYAFLIFFREIALNQNLEKKEKQALAQKYLDVLSILCERFGFFEEKSLLDDKCFEILQLKDYQHIHAILIDYERKSKNIVEQVKETLEQILKKEKFDVEIRGRYKSLLSIHRKMKKKARKDLFNFNDIFAFRIILKKNVPERCFGVLNLLHDRFYPMAGRFKDYISVPKINGYQSLHTCLTHVVSDLDLPIEVQIRTQAMDDFAEHGLAAHWVYGRHKKAKLLTGQEEKLRDYLLSRSRRGDQQTYCFSYTGDLFRLEKGATVIDFAYTIHSDLGNKASGAVVNGVPQALTYVLQPADVIEVKKSSKKQVNPDWLRHVKSKEAQRGILKEVKEESERLTN